MMKRSVLAVLALSFVAAAACQPAEEEPAGEMGEVEEAPATEQAPAAPMEPDTPGGMMQDTMMQDTMM